MFEIKQELNTANILSKIGERDIFQYYCSSFKEVGRKFNSELREDPNPSAIISEYNGRLWYNDFGEGLIKPVDCFGYVMRKYSITFLQSLGTINLDFNLGLRPLIEYPPSLNYIGLPDKGQFISSEKTNSCFTSDKLTVIKPIYRDWLEIDIKYWKNKYYLDIPRLESFGIHPISKAYINDKLITLEMPTYNYLVDKEEGMDIVKIYSPFSKNYRWLSNCKNYHYLGYNQLPWLGDKIIITKSLKDIAVLSLFKIPAIAPQSEAQVISYEMYQKLCKRFMKFYILYDNDRAGVDGAMQTVDTYPEITPIFIPESSGVKDISDFIDKYRYKATHKLINNLIC